MGKKNKDNFFTTISILIKKIDFTSMSGASKTNLLFSIIIAIVIVALSITPVLSLVDRIIISIGNIFITIFTDKPLIAVPSTSSGIDVIISVIFLFAEMLLCKFFCIKERND